MFALLTVPPGAYTTKASAVNAAGHTAGTGQRESGSKSSAYRSDAGGSFYLAEFGYGSEGYDINDSGTVVGITAIGPQGNQRRGFVSRKLPDLSNETIVLGTLGGDGNSAATAINKNGVVVGDTSTNDASAPHQAFRIANGVLLPLGCIGSLPCRSYAHDINDKGVIVGSSGGAGLVPVMWRNWLMTIMPMTLSGCGVALAINNRDQAVGFEYGNCLWPSILSAWFRDNETTYNLNALLPGYQRDAFWIGYALKINDNGQILALAQYWLGTGPSSVYVVLTPDTEPSGLRELEPNDSRSRAQRVNAVPLQVNGRANFSRDSDFYRFAIPAGQTFKLTLRPVADSNTDLFLQNANGLTLARSTRGVGLEDQIIWQNTSEVTQEFFALVRWVSGPSGVNSGDYRLDLAF